ncbi:MAG: hypothetical protein VB070_04515 [Clostridiaceae bacterium]|nr:hypothetical protein [Clostridiaceae bacterium]
MNLILADADSVYTEKLAAQLQSRLPGIMVNPCSDSASLQKIIAQQKERNETAVFLYNAVDFHELTSLSLSDRWPENWQAKPIQAGFSTLSSTQETPNQAYFRFDPVCRFVDTLVREYNCKGQKIATLPFHDLDPAVSSPADNEPEKDSNGISNHLYLMLSVCSAGYNEQIIRKKLKAFIDQGCTVIYLPLMPTYMMNCLAAPSHGPTLSDLLLHIIGQDIAFNQLSCYWQPHPDGFFQFRPPDRADDLILCNPDTLRQLVKLLREYLQQKTQSTIGLIDCAGLPLATVTMIAVLCDVCEVILSKNDNYAAYTAKYEVSQLFSVLPAECKTSEILVK